MPDTIEADKERNAFIETLQQRDIPFVVHHVYEQLLNALALEVADDDVGRIAALGLVSKTRKSRPITAPTHHRRERRIISLFRSEPKKYSALSPGIKRLHAQGIKGKGIRIGIIDDGIDYRHKGLGGCFGPECRVAYGRNYHAGTVRNNMLVYADDPLDKCRGHGTQVAGVAASSDEHALGVAPEATLGVYRALDCEGHTNSGFLFAAFEDAYKHHMDIISVPLTSDDSIGDDLHDVMNKLIENNVIIVCSIGNEGYEGLWYGKLFGHHPEVIAVGAANSPAYESHWFAPARDSLQLFPYRTMRNVHGPSGNKRLVAIEPVVSNKGICSLPDNIPLNDAVVRIFDETCNPLPLLKQAHKARVAGVLISCQALPADDAYKPVLCDPTTDKKQAADLPVLMDMSPRYYQQVTALLVAEKAGIDVIFGRSTDRFGELDKVVMSDSSAWGPELRHVYLKPDVVAPGDDIYTTFLTNSVSYMRNRGTSLSAPYVAGAIALYLGRYYGHRSKHDFLPKKMRHIIQNSAYPLKDPKRGWEPIARQGAGLLDVEKMFTGTIRVEPSAFSLGNYNSNKWSPNGVRYKSIRITNLDKVKHTYELSHHKMPFILKAVNPETTRLGRNEKPSTYEPAFDVQSLTIGPNKTKVVRVRFTEPVGIDRRDNWLCSGYIVITRQPNLYGSALTDDTVVVPYQGLWGYIGSFENAMK